MNLYTIVTNDAYELPVLCDVRAKEAAEFLKTTTNGIRKMICKPPKKTKYKPIVSGKVVHDPIKSRVKYEMTHDRSRYYQKYYKENKEKYHQRYESRKEKHEAINIV